MFHLIIYVPLSHADAVRIAAAQAGAGQIGNYDSCSFSSRGIGRYRPLKGAHPHIGAVGALEEVEEERIECVVDEKKLTAVLNAILREHPYEEPALHVIPMRRYQDFLHE